MGPLLFRFYNSPKPGQSSHFSKVVTSAGEAAKDVGATLEFRVLWQLESFKYVFFCLFYLFF